MTNQELMQLMTDMDLHEGGIENWAGGCAFAIRKRGKE